MDSVFGYIPRHVEYWVTSDGRSFDTLEEARNWERIIHSEDYNKSYTVSKSTNFHDDVFLIG